MALNSGKILMRRGQEVNFDPNKMMPGEWAVSLDSKFVRMCFSPGVCIRMATYEAFEADMEQIRQILAECESIEQAVSLINTEVSQNAKAVIEYTKESKQYRDEAKQYRDEAFSTTPDGYDSLVGQVDKNTVAINTIVEKAELNIKETAMGENIHLIDSADSELVELALYGKAKQNTTTGKNLLKCKSVKSQTINGVTFTVNMDGSIHAKGTASDRVTFFVDTLEAEEINKFNGFKLSGGTGGAIFYIESTDTYTKFATNTGTDATITIPDGNAERASIFYRISNGVTVDDMLYPMISIDGGAYEPYTGGIPAPNPDYPQEIEVAGIGGSVEVKSVGKNLLPYPYHETTLMRDGITFTVNENDGTVTANGTASANTYFTFHHPSKSIDKINVGDTYTFSGCPSGGSANTYRLVVGGYNAWDYGNGVNFTVTEELGSFVQIFIYIFSGTTVNNLVFKPMIRLASDTDDTYEPYKETISTIPTPSGIAGIKVSSGGNYTDQNGQQWICDEIVKYADGSGEKIQRIGKDIFDGSEDEAWGTESTNQTNKYRISTSKIVDLIKKVTNNNDNFNGICSAFEIVPTGGVGTYGAKTGISCGMNGKIQVYSDSYNTNDVTLWTSYLAENPMTLYYELAEPIRTPLTAEEIAEIEKLSTFYPVTNISNDFDCGMKVKYIVDSKNYIDNQLAIQAKLQEEALLNMLLLMPEEVQASMIEKDTNNLLNESEV